MAQRLGGSQHKGGSSFPRAAHGRGYKFRFQGRRGFTEAFCRGRDPARPRAMEGRSTSQQGVKREIPFITDKSFMFLESRRQPQYGTGTRAGTKRLVPGTRSSCRVLFILLLLLFLLLLLLLLPWLPGASQRSIAVRNGLHVEEADVHLGFDVDPLPHLQREGGERGRAGGSGRCPHRTPRSLQPPGTLLPGRRCHQP